MASKRFRLALISTGGTIEKTYDELSGLLENRVSVLDVMLSSLRLEDLALERFPLMNKDSLEMTQGDHDAIAELALRCTKRHDGVVVVHGTDRLAVSGERVLQRSPGPNLAAPVVFTGAMVPYALRRTDALQNLTEALGAARILPPGVYAAFHGKVLTFPGVIKDPERQTFVKTAT